MDSNAELMNTFKINKHGLEVNWDETKTTEGYEHYLEP